VPEGETASTQVDHVAIERQHNAHMKVVAASLEHFARHVVLPSFENACNASRTNPAGTTPSSGGATTPSHSESKTFLGTLLALREVMTQNAVGIFGEEAIASAVDDNDGITSAFAMRKMNRYPGHARRQKQRLEEDRLFCATLLATGVVLAAIKRYIPVNYKAMIKEFLNLVRSYDGGDEQFASCLQEDDGRSCGVLPNGKRLDPEETVALNVSFNRARENHPLIRRREEGRLKIKSTRVTVNVPKANACVVTMVENLTDWAQRPSAGSQRRV
jgi:hypothetical protein